MYEKNSEDKEKAQLRARAVFTAPRARTSSGLDPHTLYNEISSAPVTFQGSRSCRAVGALKGFVTSTRDAETGHSMHCPKASGRESGASNTSNQWCHCA